jgi:hypothetical protein
VWTVNKINRNWTNLKHSSEKHWWAPPPPPPPSSLITGDQPIVVLVIKYSCYTRGGKSLVESVRDKKNHIIFCAFFYFYGHFFEGERYLNQWFAPRLCILCFYFVIFLLVVTSQEAWSVIMLLSMKTVRWKIVKWENRILSPRVVSTIMYTFKVHG